MAWIQRKCTVWFLLHYNSLTLICALHKFLGAKHADK